MRINCISICPCQSYRPNDISRRCDFGSGINPDVFVKNPFAKFKNFTASEYNRLTLNEINCINKIIDKSYNLKFITDIKFHDVAAEGIKRTLDRIVGEGNYVVIPIGRSVSSVGKCLSYKIGDKNVKILPMSTAARFIDLSAINEDFEAFREYLELAGLSKNEIETSGKTYIFTDYCHSGASLIGAERLFKSLDIYGEKENIHFVNILYLLTDIEPREVRSDLPLSNVDFRCKFEDMLYAGSFKNYSLVERCSNLKNTKDAVIKPQNYSDEAKSFWFKLWDNEMKRRHIN